jgi:hypothetical protein
MTTHQFDEEWELLKKNHEHSSFEYNVSSKSVRETITSHFQNSQRREKHGVYVIRQQSTHEVLYIGKSGTINRQGRFKDQDIPGRLKNTKDKLSAKEWFGSLVQKKGALVIEYVFLAPSPKSPALVEAMLLQAYLNENGCLPLRNNEF